MTNLPHGDHAPREAPRSFYVGDWLVEPRRNRVSAEGDVRVLDPRAMAVLVFLVSRSGNVVTKDELMESVWEGAIVTDNAMSRTISRLRGALDDDWRNPRYIETISKNGYRLIPESLSWPASDSRTGGEVPSVAPSLSHLPVDPATTSHRRSIWLGLALGVAAIGFALYPRSEAAWVPGILDIQTASSLEGPQPVPRLSPDGSMIAFMWRDGGTNWDIYVSDLAVAGATPAISSEQDEGFPAWSGDGRHLAFVRRGVGDTCDLMRASLLDRSETYMGDCLTDVSSLDWSPDGSSVAFSARDSVGAPRRVRLLDLKTGSLAVLTDPPTDISGDTGVEFSPDGSTIAFRRLHGPGSSDLWIVPIDGQPETRSTHDERIILGQDWSPDGQSLVFSSNRTGRRQLWSLRLSDGVLAPWALHERVATYPTLSADGTRLLYANNSDKTDLHRVDLATGDKSLVAASVQAEMHPSLSPAGDRVAFISNRGDAFEVWSSALDGSGLRKHSDVQGALISAPAWSPDGSTIAFDAYRSAEPEIMLVRADGDRPESVVSGGLNPAFSRDGNHLYYSTNTDGRWEIWRVPTAGGVPEQLTSAGGYRAQEGPGASGLYYSKLESVGIFRSNLDGSDETLVTESVTFPDWGSWSVEGSGLYHVRRGPASLWRTDLNTQESTQLLVPEFGMPAWGPSLTVSADETTLVYSQMKGTDDELKVVSLR